MLEGNPERPMPAPPSPHADHPLVIALGVGLVLAAAVGTQYVAWRFAFRSTLGAPLILLSARAAQVLRGVGVLATGSALSVLFVPRLRRLSGPLVLLALCAGIASGRV